jgi:hypothetical protein
METWQVIVRLCRLPNGGTLLPANQAVSRQTTFFPSSATSSADDEITKLFVLPPASEI